MKTRVVSLTLPSFGSMDLRGTFRGWGNSLVMWFSDVVGGLGSRIEGTGLGVRSWRERRPNLPWKKIGRYGVIVAVAILLVVGAVKVLSKPGGSVSSGQTKVLAARASEEINREFNFPLRDSKGKEVNSIKFVVEKAELRDEIVVKGQKATAVEGRTFLIINLKITNEYNQRIEIDTRDYMRLSVNGNKSEWLAPDVHNDPVEIQAISTKYTRVGFPINTSDRDLVLRVGEITGEKVEIPLKIL